MAHPTLAEIIAALPYLTHTDRGRLRHALIRPIPKVVPDEPIPAPEPKLDTVSTMPGKTLKLREGSGH